MSNSTSQQLCGVAETLFIPLLVRADETLRPDALIKDEKAVSVLKKGDYDFSRVKQMKIDEQDRIAIILRNREFDRYASDFMAQFPDSVIVHLGCGLDSRFERVDNGKVEWYDLDVPEVIETRRKLLGGESGRYHFLPYSAFDDSWMKLLWHHRKHRFLFMAEGVLMYFEESQIKSLVLLLQEHFPGSEFVFDVFSPLIVWANNKRIARTKIGARYNWSMKNGKILETWSKSINLLDEWHIFDRPEPRLAKIRWMRFIPLFANAIGIYHYRLGNVVLFPQS